MLLFQFYDDVSDGEAVERVLYDMRQEVSHWTCKSASKKFDGHKVTTCIDQASELIVDIEDLAAPLGRAKRSAACWSPVSKKMSAW